MIKHSSLASFSHQVECTLLHAPKDSGVSISALPIAAKWQVALLIADGCPIEKDMINTNRNDLTKLFKFDEMYSVRSIHWHTFNELNIIYLSSGIS